MHEIKEYLLKIQYNVKDNNEIKNKIKMYGILAKNYYYF